MTNNTNSGTGGYIVAIVLCIISIAQVFTNRIAQNNISKQFADDAIKAKVAMYDAQTGAFRFRTPIELRGEFGMFGDTGGVWKDCPDIGAQDPLPLPEWPAEENQSNNKPSKK